jgi:GT2 family glycosyltransferase
MVLNVEVKSLKSEIAIIVLHYNKIRLTTRCIQSILDAGYPPGQVHCFDNGSRPGIFQQLQQSYSLCHHRRIEENLGFAGGFNRALGWVFASGFGSALFCTNDTLVSPGAAEACAHTAARTGAGMAAPLITFLNKPGAIDSTGAYFDAQTGVLHHYHQQGLPDLLDPRKDYMPGTALWIDRDTFEKLGGADESFHMYWEDVDLCFRAHREGIPLARCYGAHLMHGGGQTCRKKPLYTTYYFQRNRIRFCRRFLEGDNRRRVLEMIRGELMESGSAWEEKGDTRRMQYLKKLLEELDLPA